jgi:DNA primase
LVAGRLFSRTKGAAAAALRRNRRRFDDAGWRAALPATKGARGVQISTRIKALVDLDQGDRGASDPGYSCVMAMRTLFHPQCWSTSHVDARPLQSIQTLDFDGADQ